MVRFLENGVKFWLTPKSANKQVLECLDEIVVALFQLGVVISVEQRAVLVNYQVYWRNG